MDKKQNINEIYSLIKELIEKFQKNGDVNIAKILHHRLNIVSWTSASELLEEISCILKNELKNNQIKNENIMNQINELIKRINDYL